jgi:hypothetical protein
MAELANGCPASIISGEHIARLARQSVRSRNDGRRAAVGRNVEDCNKDFDQSVVWERPHVRAGFVPAAATGPTAAAAAAAAAASNSRQVESFLVNLLHPLDLVVCLASLREDLSTLLYTRRIHTHLCQLR